MIRYVVRPGDTLTLIAQRYGVSVSSIIEVNNIVDPNSIFIGQIILIPVSEVPTPQPPECPPCPPFPPIPPPTPPPTPRPPRRPTVTRSFDGIEYTLSLNKGTYRRGELIVIRLRKRNILSVPLTLTYRTSQKVDFRVTRGSTFIWQWSQNRVFTQALTTDRFEPGEDKVYRVAWDQRTDHTLLRPGKYTLTGWNLATPSIRLSLEFEIV